LRTQILTHVTKITEHFRLQFRAEEFDLFNHPNFGNPNLVLPAFPAGTTAPTPAQLGSFNQITSTLIRRFTEDIDRAFSEAAANIGWDILERDFHLDAGGRSP